MHFYLFNGPSFVGNSFPRQKLFTCCVNPRELTGSLQQSHLTVGMMSMWLNVCLEIKMLPLSLTELCSLGKLLNSERKFNNDAGAERIAWKTIGFDAMQARYFRPLSLDNPTADVVCVEKRFISCWINNFYWMGVVHPWQACWNCMSFSPKFHVSHVTIWQFCCAKAQKIRQEAQLRSSSSCDMSNKSQTKGKIISVLRCSSCIIWCAALFCPS